MLDVCKNCMISGRISKNGECVERCTYKKDLIKLQVIGEQAGLDTSKILHCAYKKEK